MLHALVSVFVGVHLLGRARGSHELGPRKNLPPYVCIPNQANPYAGSGYLSSAFGPFSVGSDPNAKDFTVRDLSLPSGVTPEHFEKRKTLLAKVDSHFRTMEKSDSLDAMDTFYQRAYSMISSDKARAAFDINADDFLDLARRLGP